MKKMIIMRGLPGSGKTYKANSLGYLQPYQVVYLSTDKLLMGGPNHYLFSAEYLGLAHKLNQLKALEACKRGLNFIIIDNTNTTYNEILPYAVSAMDSDYELIITEPNTDWAKDPEECFKRNTHNVPLEVIQNMLNKFEPTDSILEKLAYNKARKL